MMSKLNGVKAEKAFTLIELIVVIAVVGVLVLLAAPKFLGYTKDAKATQIASDIKSYESAIEAERVAFEVNGKEDSFTSSELEVSKSELESHVNEGSLFSKKGIAQVKDLSDDKYYKVEENLVSTELKGQFYLAKGGSVFYHDSSFRDDGSVQIPDGYTLLTDDDFEFIAHPASPSTYIVDGHSKKGYFHYKGEATKVVIPNSIMGNEVKSYYFMFYHNGDEREKVGKVAGDNGAPVIAAISTNENVTYTRGMFQSSQAKSLDVSNFNTDSVAHMGHMFFGSRAEVLTGLENFNTDKVDNMEYMFSHSWAGKLNLSSFNVDGDIIMSGMFSSSRADVIKVADEAAANVFIERGQAQSGNVKY